MIDLNAAVPGRVSLPEEIDTEGAEGDILEGASPRDTGADRSGHPRVPRKFLSRRLRKRCANKLGYGGFPLRCSPPSPRSRACFMHAAHNPHSSCSLLGQWWHPGWRGTLRAGTGSPPHARIASPPHSHELRSKDREESVNNLRDPHLRPERWHHAHDLWANPFSLRALAFLRSADVIHCHQRYIVMSSTAAALARLTGKRVFVSDLGGGGWDISRYISTANWYHGHLHISQYSRRISKQEGDPRAHVIMGGVDTGKFSPDPGLAQTGAVLFVGRILPHKGVNDLINALPPAMKLKVLGPAL